MTLILGLENHDGHIAFAMDAPGHTCVIAVMPPEMCMIYGHKWPAPFLFGAAVP